jgi:hypothetical protein
LAVISESLRFAADQYRKHIKLPGKRGIGRSATRKFSGQAKAAMAVYKRIAEEEGIEL